MKTPCECCRWRCSACWSSFGEGLWLSCLRDRHELGTDTRAARHNKAGGPAPAAPARRGDGGHGRTHAYRRPHELGDLALRFELLGDAVDEIQFGADQPTRIRLGFVHGLGD